MFTFGLFTTHIPYITLLIFYAYFLYQAFENSWMNVQHESSIKNVKQQFSYTIFSVQIRTEKLYSTLNSAKPYFHFSKIFDLKYQTLHESDSNYKVFNRFSLLKVNLPPPFVV